MLPEVSDDELMARALRAYWTAARKHGGGADQPSRYSSGIEYTTEHKYAVLRNGAGILALYRIRNDGVLKRLKRWPMELETGVPAKRKPKGE